MSSESDAESRAARVGPDAVARTTFPTSFRGYDPDHVRVFLEHIASELREARDREAALRTELEAAEARAESASHPDEAQLTATLGEETVRVLLAAREAATEIRSKGEESVARLLREAQDEATRMKSEAETILGRRTQEAEEAALSIRTIAEAEQAAALAAAEAAVVELLAAGEAAADEATANVAGIVAAAEAEAEDILETARAQGREMVDEALLVRKRVLEDLSRKRKAARIQLERLQGGRERLLESYDIVWRTLDEATAELKGSLKAAKRVADAAARRVEAEPEATAEQLEAEVEAARDAGLPLVDDESELEDFDEQLPEGEMVPIEPSADFEEVRVIEDLEPEPDIVVMVDGEPVDVDVVDAVEVEVDVVEVVEVIEVVAEVDDDDGEATDVDVDDLFARIRAARAEEVAHAHEVLADDSTAVPATDEPAVEIDDVADPVDESPTTTADDVAPAPPAPDEQALLERRDAATDAAEQKAARKLKRVLADEQNEVLDRLRRNSKVKLADLLPSPKEHASRYADAAAGALSDAAQAGASFYGDDGTVASVDVLADELGEALALPLRERVSASLREAAGDDEALADGVRAAYRDWKTHRIGMQTRDTVFAAFNLGLYEATPPDTVQRWLVDDGGSPCPDAEDNSLAGLVVKGEPYPTGHCFPPAHPGCRCLLVPAPH
jgi:DivIVA domain-containing protein